jgi:cation:H+ antiporter
VLPVLLIVLGLALLVRAADQFVLGAARLSASAGVRPLAVGVVVIGFGTSLPEAVVSVLAAIDGEIGVAIGNVVGSNLANLGLILGIGVLILPIAVHSDVIRREAPIVVAASIGLGLAIRGGVSDLEAVLLLAAMGLVTWRLLAPGPTDVVEPEVEEFVEAPSTTGKESARTVLGLIGTLAGAQALLTGALDLAEEAGLSAGFVGSSIVAVGTSLPELVTAVQSARRGKADLLVGNLLGSNLFNALVVAGLAGLVADTTPVGAPLATFGAVFMVAQAALAWLLMRSERRLTRIEGGMLILTWAVALPFLL